MRIPRGVLGLLVIGAVASAAKADPRELARTLTSCALVEARRLESDKLEDAAFELSLAESARRPTLGLSVQDDRQNHDGAVLRQRVDSLDVSAPLYDPSLAAGVASGRGTLAAERARLLEVASTVAREAISELVELFRARAHFEVLKAELATVERLALVSGAAEQAGLGDRSDALLARAALERIRVRVELAGLEVGRRSALFEKRRGYRAPVREPEVLELEAQEKSAEAPLNPALATSAAELSALDAQIGREKAFWQPRLGFSGGLYRQNGDLPHDGYRVGVQLDLSGWFRGRETRAALEGKRALTEARRSRDQQLWDEEQRLLETEFRALSRQQEGLARAGAASERALELARERMALGRLRYTEFALIQGELRALKFELIELRTRRLALALTRLQQRELARASFDAASCPAGG